MYHFYHGHIFPEKDIPPAPGEEARPQTNTKGILKKWESWINQWDMMRGGPENGFQLLHLWDVGGMKDQEAYRMNVYQTIRHAWIKEHNAKLSRH